MQITVDILSKESIQKATERLTNYADDLEDKCNLLVKKLLEIGVNVSELKIKESPLGKYVLVTTDISSGKAVCNGVLISTGEIKQSNGFEPFSILLAIEFGAGIHYNKTPNPNANELGFGVGTFPGQIHAFQNEGWMYWDEEKREWRHSYGVKATMPMYNANIKMLEQLKEISKEVFR